MPKRIVIHCKMRGNYVDDRADPGHMQGIDQFLQLTGRPVSRRRGKKARTLISPAAVERMLRQRHEFYVCVMVFFDIFNELIRDLIILVPSLFHFPVRIILPVRIFSLPGTQMQLIDVEGFVKIPSPVLHPLGVGKLEFIEIPYYGCEIRPQLHAETVRVAVLHPAVSAIDDIFVHLTFFRTLNSDLIELGADGLCHLFFLPVVKFAYNRDSFRLRRESPKDHGVSLDMSSQILISVIHITHVELLKIHDDPPCVCY